jgi:hypothetical protein
VKTRAALLLAVVLLGAAGCAGGPGFVVSSEPNEGTAPSPSDSPWSGGVRIFFFPTWPHRWDEALPAAGVSGTLVEHDGCLFLGQGYGMETLPLWEEGFSFRQGTLVDGSGRAVAGIGEMVHGGGGYFGRLSAEDLTGQRIPPACQTGRPDGYVLIWGVRSGPGP